MADGAPLSTKQPQLAPVQIGPVTIAEPVILAPLTGVTDLPFRRVVKQHGAGLVVSEMIASQAMVREVRQAMLKASFVPEEFPMAVQLAGNEPEVIAEAAKLNEDRGAQIIDLNFGCPVKKIVNGHAGSHLMRDEVLAGKIMEAAARAVSVPVTLKMRMGWDHQSLNAPTLARIAENSGIKLITIHGRTRCQLYTGTADWGFIRTVKDVVNLPVIANGDIVSLENAREALEQSGANGVMIGRGSYGRPWFVGQVMQYLKTGEILPEPDLATQHRIIRAHFDDCVRHYGEVVGVRMMRKHLGWYTRGLHSGAEFRGEIMRMSEAKDVIARIDSFYLPLIERGVVRQNFTPSSAKDSCEGEGED